MCAYIGVFVCAADFGLAKQKRADCSRINSVVGTILCSWYSTYLDYCNSVGVFDK